MARSGPQTVSEACVGLCVCRDLQAESGPPGSRDHHGGEVTSRRHVPGTGREGGKATLGPVLQ